MTSSIPDASPIESDVPAEDRVHHHARTGSDLKPADSGTIVTLCGLHLPGPRAGAAKLPCCPMCALTMGKPCN
jgi:hypothetical protein